MRTVLYDHHCAHRAQFVDFGGWEMPLQYSSILEEHKAVRTRVGLFDVSHMGRISIKGPDAEAFLDYLAANKIAEKKDNSATYSVFCAPNGTCVDDSIIYRIDRTRYFLIANAANRQKDVDHLLSYAKDYRVSIIPRFNEEGILAIQGPAAISLMHTLFLESQQLLKPMQFMEIVDQGCKMYLSTTGYTGASGFEIYAPNSFIPRLWEHISKLGASHGILPVGLGARNTLRLEMGYALYGHEIDDTIAPTESIARWSVKLDKPDFLGKSALVELERVSARRSAYGVMLLEPGIMRDHYPVFRGGIEIGKVTSGSYSPTLEKFIGLILSQVPLNLGECVDVQIRGRLCSAQVAKVPFITQ
ncbi:MAG: glycine cleavage system aminomethyltransferase GcvT [Parachlamydiaceae bacterium]